MKYLYFFICLLLVVTNYGQNATDDWTFHHGEDDGWFGDLVVANNGNVVVGGGGANSHFRIFDGSAWTLYTPQSLGVDHGFYGRQLAVDGDNVVWLAQGNNDGLSSWDGTTLRNYNTENSGIGSNSIFAVGTDSENKVWHSRFQSFDGTEWEDMTWPTCHKGGARKVFVTSEDEVWITGVPSIGIETGSVTQPCVYHVKDGVLTSYHFDDGANLPVLTANSGYHLAGELSDGTVFLLGRTEMGIEVKRFNGTAWEDWLNFDDSTIALSSYWSMIVNNDVVWIAGSYAGDDAQIVKLCHEDWTVYDLPSADGFSETLFGIAVDQDDHLWICGDGGIGSVALPPGHCSTTDTRNAPVGTEWCEAVQYNEGSLSFFQCSEMLLKTEYQLYNALGQLCQMGEITSSTLDVGQLTGGVYFLSLQGEEYERQVFRFVAQGE